MAETNYDNRKGMNEYENTGEAIQDDAAGDTARVYGGLGPEDRPSISKVETRTHQNSLSLEQQAKILGMRRINDLEDIEED